VARLGNRVMRSRGGERAVVIGVKSGKQLMMDCQLEAFAT
jgi:hypothetical protein